MEIIAVIVAVAVEGMITETEIVTVTETVTVSAIENEAVAGMAVMAVIVTVVTTEMGVVAVTTIVAIHFLASVLDLVMRITDQVMAAPVE